MENNETKVGRPKIQFDLERVEMCGYFHATYETMAYFFDCSIDTIRRQMQNTESEFCHAYKKGLSNMKMRLSEAQLKSAMKGNATMQIWLGRNYLGQSENPKEEYFNLGQNVLYNFSLCLPHQVNFAVSKDRFVALVGGYRSGKTHALPWRYIIQATNRKFRGIPMRKIVISPTFRILQDVVIPKYKEIFDIVGIIYEEHKSDYTIVVTTEQYEGEIKFRSADDPTKLIGLEATDIDIDEFDTLKKNKQQDIYEKVIARLSGASDSTLGITTTPEGYRYTYELFVEKRIGKLIQVSTDDNVFLPKEYVEMLYEQYPKQLVEQYVKGKFLNVNYDKAYSEFYRSLHCGVNQQKLPKTLLFGIDFNVNPMTAVVAFYDGQRIYIVDEFWVPHSNTRQLADIITEKYPPDKYELIACPDMTGGSRKTSAEMTDLEILESKGFKIKGIRNIKVKDRLNLVNNAFEKDKIFIDEKCRYLIRDLEQVSLNQYGELDKSDYTLTHISDAFGYLVVALLYTNQGKIEAVGT